jgi:hypothetical protein
MEEILEHAVADESIPVTQEMVDALSPVRRHYAATLLMCLPGISDSQPWRGNLSMDNLFNSPVFASFVSALRLTTNGTMRYAGFVVQEFVGFPCFVCFVVSVCFFVFLCVSLLFFCFPVFHVSLFTE